MNPRDDWANNAGKAFDKLKQRLQLTEREKDVLTRKRAGQTLKSIAAHYSVSPPTIAKDAIQGEAKETELQRTICCPHCSGNVHLYSD